mmetsp:Transcript_34728/g.86375  ORF Transcript_34728/g.86375 Transcript_34728/m.86375 type:complete len:305 (-) Transcript_34728:500-1414(-)
MPHERSQCRFPWPRLRCASTCQNATPSTCGQRRPKLGFSDSLGTARSWKYGFHTFWSMRPSRIPACTAAPSATASSGLSSGLAWMPVMRLMKRPIIGIRVAPPTSRTLVTGTPSSLMRRAMPSRLFRRAIRRHRHATCCRHSCTRGGACASSPLARVPICALGNSTPLIRATSSIGSTSRSTSGRQIASSFLRVRVTLSPSSPTRNGTSTATAASTLSASFASSAASRSLRRPNASTASPYSPTKASSSHCATAASQSSPPRRGSPEVATTSTTPPPTSRMETSKVPPPRSKTITRSSARAVRA